MSESITIHYSSCLNITLFVHDNEKQLSCFRKKMFSNYLGSNCSLNEKSFSFCLFNLLKEVSVEMQRKTPSVRMDSTYNTEQTFK